VTRTGAATGQGTPSAGSILVVEDDPDLLSLMEMILGGDGYRVRTARDGREALARVKESMPSLVFLDMRMPGMNGWEFAREFHARHGAGCPIVVVTAAEDARKRAEEIAAQGWLAKPFEIADVLAAAAKYAGAAARAPAP
jgi:CheY-like chemotaxis protein